MPLIRAILVDQGKELGVEPFARAGTCAWISRGKSSVTRTVPPVQSTAPKRKPRRGARGSLVLGHLRRLLACMTLEAGKVRVKVGKTLVCVALAA
jgi:hypothetical protein